MLLIVPQLFADPRLVEAALPGLAAPGLATLLARGRLHPCAAMGTEGALASALGLPRQHDWPIAPLLAQAEAPPAPPCALLVQPVHFALMRDRVVFTGTPAPPSADESRALLASLTAHFGASPRPLSSVPGLWVQGLDTAPDLETTPPSLALGRNVERVLPAGRDARHWRGWMNEAQMLLHDHPVNQTREARGLPTLNALWLWGAGTLPPCPTGSPPLFADAPLARALAQACGHSAAPLPASGLAAQTHPDAVILLDTLPPHALALDAGGWGAALTTLDATWFAPLAHGLRRLPPAGLTVLDPVAGQCLSLGARDGWRVWRRPSLTALLTPR